MEKEIKIYELEISVINRNNGKRYVIFQSDMALDDYSNVTLHSTDDNSGNSDIEDILWYDIRGNMIIEEIRIGER